MGNGEDFGGKRKNVRQERVGSVTANPDNLENSKEAGEGALGTQDLSKNVTSRESVPFVTIGHIFRNEYH